MYPHLGIPSCPSRSVPPHASEVTRILRSVGISWLNLFLTLAQLESDHRYSVVSGVFGLAYPGGSSWMPENLSLLLLCSIAWYEEATTAPSPAGRHPVRSHC